MLHCQAEELMGRGRPVIPLPGRRLKGLTTRKPQKRWGCRAPARLCSEGVRGRDSHEVRELGSGRLQTPANPAERGGAGAGQGSIAFCSQFCGRRGGGGLGLDTPCPPSVPLGRWVLVKRMEPGLGRKKAKGGSMGASPWFHPSARDAPKCCTLLWARLDQGQGLGAGRAH